jgi:cellulose synthase/poly-beta-1,6-N-acetylglucosamine synthase-like glycosyltransferase
VSPDRANPIGDILATRMQQPKTIDILMITYRRPHYTRLSLTRLLETCNESMRVWLWHNGDHAETLELVQSFAKHPRVHRFHHCPENERLRVPTNWLFTESKGDFVTKVDDDCLMPLGWGETLVQAMEDEPSFGILGCWPFQLEDFDPTIANWKIQTFGRHQVMRNMWVGGSGYLMRRECVQKAGIIGPTESFTGYCMRVAFLDYVTGWYWPPLRQPHLDDPREPLSAIKTDADLLANLPLSAQRIGILTRADWAKRLQRSARVVQQASIDPRDYRGLRKKFRHGMVWLKKKLGIDSYAY